jgi:spermidine/putrescine transport system ATP-binding protein
MSQDFAVELQHVSKRFGDVAAVDDVSLQIPQGEFFSLLGPSGCGKTTTLRMIAGFELPTSGEIVIQGQPMGATPPYQRHVNTVFQSYALFPHLTVGQNIAFGLEMRGVPKAERAQRVADALRLVRLDDYAHRRPKQLSGGQQQRVALARALVNEPSVLLLDEPLGALDLKLRKELQIELRALQERVGITFIYVTHDQEEALTMSDRIAVMHRGKMLQAGTPAEIYERPSSRFVADFIGETNFLHGTVIGQGEGRAQVKIGDGLVVEGISPRPVTLGSEAAVAIRPEKARLDVVRPASAHNVFPAVIDRIVYVGADTRVLAKIDGGHPFVTRAPNDVPTDSVPTRYVQGDPVFISCPVENAFVLVE